MKVFELFEDSIDPKLLKFVAGKVTKEPWCKVIISAPSSKFPKDFVIQDFPITRRAEWLGKTGSNDVYGFSIKADASKFAKEFSGKVAWQRNGEVMRVNEIFGFGKKKEDREDYSKDRGDVTKEDRDLIKRFLGDGYGNLNMKKDNGDYVIPTNVTWNYYHTRMNFFKHKGQLKASIGWYGNNNDPGNPRKSPMTSTTELFDTEDKFRKFRDEIQGNSAADQVGSGSRVSKDDLAYKDFKERR